MGRTYRRDSDYSYKYKKKTEKKNRKIRKEKHFINTEESEISENRRK